MLTSWSEVSTPPELSMASVLSLPPPRANSMRPRWVSPRLAPSPTTRQRSSRASTRTPSLSRSPASASPSSLALTKVPMPPNQSRSTSARSRARSSSSGATLPRRMPKRARTSGDSAIGLGAAREDPAAGGDQRRVVVAPRGAGQREQPPALGERRRRIGVGVDEDVLVVEGADQAEVRGEQHAVAEDVARHVADADDGDLLALDVDAQLAEVPLDRLPGAPGGDPHRLVVVARRAAGGEGVAQPEAVLGGDRVGEVGEGRRPLVGGDHQVGVVVVVAHQVGRRHHRLAAQVVGEVEEAADHRLVALDGLALQLLAPAPGRRPLDDEAALGAHRDDHRVLDHLRLHQPQHLGAEVLRPVRPADAAAGHLAAAQVDRLGARRVDEDLVERLGQRQALDRPRVELERQVGLGAAVGLGGGGAAGNSWCAGSSGSGCGSGGGCGPRRGPPTAVERLAELGVAAAAAVAAPPRPGGRSARWNSSSSRRVGRGLRANAWAV